MIVAAVVCGPGSILTSSKVGAEFGYSAIWILVLACLLMVGMVSLATRIGISFDGTPCQEIANRLGRPVAVMIGIVMFLIIASFQSSNNFAIAAGLEAFSIRQSKPIAIAILVILNLVVVGFLYLSRDLYRAIELAMKFLVGCMVIAFLINCVVARPDMLKVFQGLVPSRMDGDQWLLVALIGTTFSVAAAFYQAYLARERHWNLDNARAGMIDSIAGITTLGVVTLIIMLTSAAVFYQQPDVPTLNTANDVALQLKPLFGVAAQYVFGIGIFAGAISSFLVNALIGGHILADGLGLGDKIESPWTKHLTTLALLAGMAVAVTYLLQDQKPVRLIIFAQALTIVGVPALALALIYLGFLKRRSNPQAMPIWILLSAIAGLFVTSLLAYRTTMTVVDKLSKLFSESGI